MGGVERRYYKNLLVSLLIQEFSAVYYLIYLITLV